MSVLDEEIIIDKIIDPLNDPYLENDKCRIEKKPLKEARTLFDNLKIDPSSVLFSEGRIDKRLLKNSKSPND